MRRAALEIIKLCMHTREGIARFESVRQALALMDHPDIVRAQLALGAAPSSPFGATGFQCWDDCDRRITRSSFSCTLLGRPMCFHTIVGWLSSAGTMRMVPMPSSFW